MNQTQLKYFLAVADNQSFTKTSEQYYITQTAITQSIQSLEKSVGCALFDRGTRPIKLTPAGKALYVEAKNILKQMSFAVSRAHDAANGINGTLRIGFYKGSERTELSATIRRFHRENPNIFITFDRLSSERLSDSLLGGSCDIVVGLGSTSLKSHKEVENLVIENFNLVVGAYSGHPITQHLKLKRSDLAGEKLLYLAKSESADSIDDAVFMQLYKDAGYQPDFTFRSTDIESILMMITAEQGISVLPDFFTNKLIGADNLVFIPLVGESETEELAAFWKKGNQNPALKSLVRFLKTER